MSKAAHCPSVPAGQRRQVGQVAQAHEVKERARGHQQVVLVVRDEPTLQEGVQGAVAARATDELDPGACDRLLLGDDGQHLWGSHA
jgi:hypothetical protein